MVWLVSENLVSKFEEASKMAYTAKGLFGLLIHLIQYNRPKESIDQTALKGRDHKAPGAVRRSIYVGYFLALKGRDQLTQRSIAQTDHKVYDFTRRIDLAPSGLDYLGVH
jgi:hypothetical protein